MRDQVQTVKNRLIEVERGRERDRKTERDRETERQRERDAVALK